MAHSRFPKLKYVAQLRAVESELAWWQARYHDAAQDTHPEWLQGRFMDREAILGVVREELVRIIRDIEVLPRLA